MTEAHHHIDTHDVMADAVSNDDHAHSPEEIRKEMRVYLTVFASLGFLTLVTVAARVYLHLSTAGTIIVALFIASVKGFLVAGYFMHLLSEKKAIYSLLLITVFFFLVLLWGPWHHHYDQFGQ